LSDPKPDHFLVGFVAFWVAVFSFISRLIFGSVFWLHKNEVAALMVLK